MRNNLKQLEEKIQTECILLQQTAPFLLALMRRKSSELEFVIKQMETNYSDSLEARANKIFSEIKNLNNKIEWEKKRCTELDDKVKHLQSLKESKFFNQLSAKIKSKKTAAPKEVKRMD